MLTGEDVSSLDMHIDANQTTLAAKGLHLCEYYAVARPVFLVVKKLLFFKPKWQTAIQVFVDAMDEACPAS